MNQIDNIMEQAQVFASAWALAGGRFDSGDGFEVAEQEKQALRAAIEQALECAVDYTGGAAWSPSATKQCIEAADVLREVLGETE